MTAVRVYRAHASPPVVGAAEVTEILRAGGRYYNALVEIERHRSERFNEIRRELAPELAAREDEYARLDDRAEELVRAIKQSRRTHWRKTSERTRTTPGDLEGELAKIQAEKRRVSAEATPLRRAFVERLAPDNDRYKTVVQARGAAGVGPRSKERINAEVLEEMVADPRTDPVWVRVRLSDAQALRERKVARSRCGLPPGTYLTIEDAVARAIKDSNPRPPRFRAARGGGRVAVQLHKTTWADVIAGTSTFLRLRPNPIPGRKGRSSEHFLADIRVGSNGRAPVWATFPVRVHRQPPDDALVKWAWVTVWRVGERTHYELQFVLGHAAFDVSTRLAGVGDGGHIRIGWRQTETGVRVASWPAGELEVPTAMLARAQRVERLLSHADTHYNHVVRVLALFLRGRGMRWDHLRPARARHQLRAVLVAWAEHHFGAPGVKLLWKRWREERLAAGRDLFCALREADRALRTVSPEARLAWWCYLWTRKDAHLRQWAADAQRRFENARDAHYRAAAIKLATTFETITIDNYSITDVRLRPKPVSLPGDEINETAQHNGQLAAPGRFREILLEVMGKRCTPCPRSEE